MPPFTQTCCVTGKPFTVSKADQAMLQKLAPTISGQRFDLPLPTLCPEERRRRRLMFRNERSLYHRKCDLCQRQIISMYPAESSYTIYCRECWWSDKWDARTYGRDFDFSRPFFEQFAELLQVVPRINLVNDSYNENSEYVNFTGHLKNCYLCFDTGFSESVFYSRDCVRTRNSVDSEVLFDSELCYDSFHCKNSYRLVSSKNCFQCNNSFFLEDCRSCSNCFGCVGLRNKEYCFYNEQLNKEEYERRLSELKLHTYTGFQASKAAFESFKLRFPKAATVQSNCEDCSGDHLSQAKNVSSCFNSSQIQDCHYCYGVEEAQNCMDYESWGNKAELVYESMTVGENAHQVLFSNGSWGQVTELIYTDFCMSSSFIFGSVGLRRKEYCIFNKQYSKEAYEELAARIIEHMQKTGEWGEFFPVVLSPFSYNETVAQEVFPLNEAEAVQRGYRWKADDPSNRYQGPDTLLPDSIDDVSDDITKAVLRCQSSDKLYKIIPEELAFYRQLRLPLPRLSPNERYFQRLQAMNPEKLWRRNCDKCRAEIETSYAPDRPETVYCEVCHLKTLY